MWLLLFLGCSEIKIEALPELGSPASRVIPQEGVIHEEDDGKVVAVIRIYKEKPEAQWASYIAALGTPDKGETVDCVEDRLSRIFSEMHNLACDQEVHAKVWDYRDKQFVVFGKPGEDGVAILLLDKKHVPKSAQF